MGNVQQDSQNKCYECLRFIGRRQIGDEEGDSQLIQMIVLEDKELMLEEDDQQIFDVVHDAQINIENNQIIHQDEHEAQINTDNSENINIDDEIQKSQQFICSIPSMEFVDEQQMNSIGQQGKKILQDLLNKPIDDMELIMNENNLDGVKIWCKYHLDDQNHYISIMRYNFTIKGTIDNYIAFISDLQLQMKIESGIEAYERSLESQQISLQYLRYKKVLMMDSRDFLYVKFSEQLDNKLIEVSKSVEIQDFKPIVNCKTQAQRAHLLLSGNIIEIREDGYLEFNAYSEVNMKLKIKPALTRGKSASEIKKFKEKMQKYLLKQ